MSQVYWLTTFAKEEILRILCKEILCKEFDAKKAKENITLILPIWGHFGSKPHIFGTFFTDIYFFRKYMFQ